MPVRDFSAGGVVRTSLGLADTSGAMTYVALLKFAASEASQWVLSRANASHSSAGNWASLGREPELHIYPSGTDAGFAPPTNEWVLVAATKEAGSTKAKYYYYRFSTKEWFSAESTSAFTPAYTGTPSEFQLGRWNSTEQFKGRYAAAMVYNKALSEAEVKALATAKSIEGWLSTSPKALWTFSQKSVEEKVKDITGGEADETTREGTSVAEEEPPIPYVAASSRRRFASVT